MTPGDVVLAAGVLMVVGSAACLLLSIRGELHDVPPKYREWLFFSLLMAGVRVVMRQAGWSQSLEYWGSFAWASVGLALCAIAWQKWQSRPRHDDT